jgi:hypothetical protein
MNCQITKIHNKYLELQMISSKPDGKYSISSVVRISQNEYLLDEEVLEKKPSKSFAFVNQIGQKTLKLELFEPELYVVGKIIKIEPVENKFYYTPEIINDTIIAGQSLESKSTNTKLYEFIPTVQINESVVVGQKIGYLNIKSHNHYKYWILSEATGVINKIELGEFQYGNSIAIINKQNHILGDFNSSNSTGDNTLLKIDSVAYDIELINEKISLDQKVKSTFKNCIIDFEKKFLNSVKPVFGADTIVIFFTDTDKFASPTQNTTIKIIDKFGLGNYYEKAINDLALSICQSGNSVVIISDVDLKLPSLGRYKSINGEEIDITSILVSNKEILHNSHFDNIIVIY